MRDRDTPDRRPTGERNQSQGRQGPDRREQRGGQQPPRQGQQGGAPQGTPGTGQPPQRGGQRGQQGGGYTPPGQQSHHTPHSGTGQQGSRLSGGQQGGGEQPQSRPTAQQQHQPHHGSTHQAGQTGQQSAFGQPGQQSGFGQGGQQSQQGRQAPPGQHGVQPGRTGQQSGGQQAGQGMARTQTGQQFGGVQQQHSPARNIPIEPVGVERIAREEVVTADRDTPIATVVAMMEEQDVGTVVITEDDRPAGIITDRKIALALEETPDLTQRSVEDLMSEDPVTVTQDEELFDAVRTLSENDIRRVPVVDDEGTLSGILSLDDVLVVLSGELSSATDVIREQSPRF
ncbi:CBS domain-containing protein [Halostella sp. PRR32]|uniref:CBS domain-containing protein n=1 Tax=Halostella sp. PRR32 TaxID=3098147 RepID=UPI002B1DD9FD|nr:CBS domain-containing protein [Halostella sp. PRR32]